MTYNEQQPDKEIIDQNKAAAESTDPTLTAGAVPATDASAGITPVAAQPGAAADALDSKNVVPGEPVTAGATSLGASPAATDVSTDTVNPPPRGRHLRAIITNTLIDLDKMVHFSEEEIETLWRALVKEL